MCGQNFSKFQTKLNSNSIWKSLNPKPGCLSPSLLTAQPNRPPPLPAWRFEIWVLQVSNVRRSRVGSNDAEFDDDTEDPDYVEDQVEEFEGKSYRPSLIMLNPEFYKHKTWPTIKTWLFIKCMVWYFDK